ncbi:hypothetical protein NDU88_001300 [Pleurodeles waltl]|uniref:Uncharacterized protein n=1 Tax=Pleurodeles waltl TaxID=8319 RepID=A0AAV7U8Y3_PLEWA|nr:hypothetical protein NDU88_001300 [Pleurodeles waltl]
MESGSSLRQGLSPRGALLLQKGIRPSPPPRGVPHKLMCKISAPVQMESAAVPPIRVARTRAPAAGRE